MHLTHKIALCPSPEQADYFKRACGTARKVWNWALGEWNKQYEAGQKPNAMALKKQFNALKYSDSQWLDKDGRPWLRDIHRDAHSQPFAHLAKAWNRFFADLEAGKPAHPPQFKKKGRCRDSFYVANDKLTVANQAIRLPKIGWVRMRKVEAAKVAAGFVPNARLPKGAKLPESNNRKKSAQTLARLHARIANIRADFLHKLTTRLCCENQAVGIEDLHVKGMLANDKLARALSDVGFGRFRAQMEYKAKRYGTQLIIADRWYPSSRLCSVCGWKNEALTLKDREWTCPACGTHHDRDYNAALNLQRLATATALPEASPAGNGGAAAERVSAVVGKVTPVRYECGHQDTSGQEGNRAHLRARS
jgi:putative transposase